MEAQVGVNTTSPQAQLDIRSSNQATPSNTDGILIPKIDAFPVTNPTAAQTGMLVYLTTLSGANQPGFYYWNNATASWLPISKTDDDWYEVGSTNPPNNITDNMFHTGNVAIGKSTAGAKLDVEQSNPVNYALRARHLNAPDITSSSAVEAEIISNQASGAISAMSNRIEANNDVQGIGVYNNFQGNTADFLYGFRNGFFGSGTGIKYGFSNYFDDGTGSSYGLYNTFDQPSTVSLRGVYNGFLNTAGAGNLVGVENYFTGSGDGAALIGMNSSFSSTSTSNMIGLGNNITNACIGAGTKYGMYSIIDPSAGGLHYGVYSQATKSSGYAGYFLGRVSIGTTVGNSYILPLTRGTTNQIMQTDGVGNVTWQNPNTALNSFAWTTTGNSGTNSLTNFIGTTDNSPLQIRVNNEKSGLIDHLSYNTFFGYQAGSSVTTGLFNTANGTNALQNNTSGSSNTAIGNNALRSNTTGGNNTATGTGALQSNTTGISNTAAGRNSLFDNTTGSFNTANGDGALMNNTSGTSNTANGMNALHSNTTGYSNTALGTVALYSNTTGYGNTASGIGALQNNTIGNFNIGVGNEALRTNTSGSNNLAVGNGALYSSSTPSFNVALGNNALYYNSTGANNLAIGVQALYSNLTSSNNIAIGNSVLYANTMGARNIGIGAQSLTDNISGNYNIALGNSTLKDNTTGDENVAIGDFTLQLNTTGDNNTSVGTRSLFYNTTGYSNTALGFNALFTNTTGSGNVGIGFSSLVSNTSGVRNIGIGPSSMYSNTTGNDNIAIGTGTLHENIIGSKNIVIGYEAGYNETGSNKLYIENSNSATPLIYGEFDTDILRANSQRFFINDPTVNGIQMMLKNSNRYQHFVDANLNFGTAGGDFLMATSEGFSETAGIRGDGNNVSIWSPGDGARQLRILDEDAWGDNNGNPYDNAAEVAYIAANGQYFQVSDRNKKENIKKIDNALNKISTISGYTYQFKLKSAEIEKGEKPAVSSGVLAQEIESVLPEAIQKNEYGEYFVDYAAITPLLIEAIKEQNTKIQSLEQRLQQLEEKLSK